jgi:hypothetical protein
MIGKNNPLSLRPSTENPIFSAAALDLQFAAKKTLDPRVSFTRASSATFVDSSGVLQSAVTNEPRFDHNPTTGESLGLLLEEARTNLLTYSEQFDNAAWSKSAQNAALAPVVTPNAAIGPDGNFTADKVVFQTTGTTSVDRSRLRSNATANPGTTTTWTFSIWARTSDETTHSRLALIINNAESALMADVSPQWKRFTCTRTNTSFIEPEIRLTGSTATYAEVHLWGAQVEVGAFPTSYIPTTTATVTRAADVASITGANFSSWYNVAEGSVFANYRSFATAGYPDVFNISDGTNPNRQQLFIDGSNGFTTFRELVSNVQQGIASQVLALNAEARSAGAYSSIGLVFTLNGLAPSANANATHPTGLNRLSIGSSAAGNVNYLNGTIKRLTYWPTRLSNITLQQITR